MLLWFGLELEDFIFESQGITGKVREKIPLFLVETLSLLSDVNYFDCKSLQQCRYVVVAASRWNRLMRYWFDTAG